MADQPSYSNKTTVTAGSKRKRDDGPKYYAVRAGKRPGIYSTWDECAAQVNGFTKPAYKRFSTLAEAESFVAGTNTSRASRPNATKFYAVHAGHVPGVYESWPDAQQQIAGFKNAIHKAFPTRAEAEQFVLNRQASVAATPEPVAKKSKTSKGKAAKDVSMPVDLADYAPGEAPLPEGTEDGFDSSIILDEESGALRYRTDEETTSLKPRIARPTKDNVMVIYTDGSALGNGRNEAIAGVGVYFGPKDSRNVSEGLVGARQTNQRAELTGILRALSLAPPDQKIEIRTDSKYSIDCVTSWYQGWRRRGWVNSSNKPVENKDLIMKILTTLEDRQRSNQYRANDSTDPVDGGPWEKGAGSVKFTWVKGHAKDAGNNAADELAVKGAMEARALHAAMGNDDPEI